VAPVAPTGQLRFSPHLAIEGFWAVVGDRGHLAVEPEGDCIVHNTQSALSVR
jgi:hypothetical protein